MVFGYGTSTPAEIKKYYKYSWVINSTRELSYDVLISLVVKLLHMLSTVLTHYNNNADCNMLIKIP